VPQPLANALFASGEAPSRIAAHLLACARPTAIFTKAESSDDRLWLFSATLDRISRES
jgi:hypothetical protein